MACHTAWQLSLAIPDRNVSKIILHSESTHILLIPWLNSSVIPTIWYGVWRKGTKACLTIGFIVKLCIQTLNSIFIIVKLTVRCRIVDRQVWGKYLTRDSFQTSPKIQWVPEWVTFIDFGWKRGWETPTKDKHTVTFSRKNGKRGRFLEGTKKTFQMSNNNSIEYSRKEIHLTT